jgi:glycine cleavage system aminomethyltransferase T
VVKDGKDAGFVTSGAYAQGDGTCMVLARVDGPAAKAGAKFEVEIFGERYPATVVDRAV